MSPTDSDMDMAPVMKPGSNVYTVLLILSCLFLAGGIALIYLTLMPYLPAS